MRPLGLTVFLVALQLAGSGTVAGTRSFSVGVWGNVEIDVPSGWNAERQGPGASGGPAIRISPPDSVPLVMLITPFPVPGDGQELASGIQETIAAIVEAMREISVEDQLPVRELKGSGCVALYVSATDRTVEEPSLEDFKFGIQGAAAIGSLMATFTILTNLKDAPERLAALEIIRTARHTPPGPPWITKEGSVSAQYPRAGISWRLALDLPGFEMEPAQLKGGGEGIRLAGQHPETGMMVTVFLEKATSGWAATDHREAAWETTLKASPMDRQDVRRSESGEMALLEYRVPEYNGFQVNQKSVNAYLVHDGVWIDVHISKVEFEDSDVALFEAILGSIRFEDQE